MEEKGVQVTMVTTQRYLEIHGLELETLLQSQHKARLCPTKQVRTPLKQPRLHENLSTGIIYMPYNTDAVIHAKVLYHVLYPII